MKPITIAQRIYFAVICVAAFQIAILGLFFPAKLATILPWATVPPLHARFIGSIYGFGAIFLLSCLLSRRGVHWGLFMTVIWTGILGLISYLHLSNFDLGRLAERVWFTSYTVYPLAGLLLLWQQRPWLYDSNPSGKPLPNWVKMILQVQGIIIAVLALLLLVAPAFMVTIWPWKVTPLLAQLYSGPMLAYGVGSLLFSRERNFSVLRAVVPAMLVFTIGTLASSFIHRGLFSFGEISDLLWFGFFIAATIALLIILVALLRVRARDDT
jgi:hypothetical protein